jgi:cholesterol transport system auxiliary component
MKNLYWLLIVCITFFISSCTLLSPVHVESKNNYVLNTLPETTIKKSRRRITLFVADPSTNSLYDTRQIAYSVQPYQIGYFAKNMWVSKPSDMLQPLIVQSLQNTHYFHAVIAPPVSGQYEYSLNTQIEELLQDYTHAPGILHLTVKAEIIRMSSQKIIASKQFIITIPIPQKSPYGGVFAANKATKEMLRQLTQFCLKTI